MELGLSFGPQLGFGLDDRENSTHHESGQSRIGSRFPASMRLQQRLASAQQRSRVFRSLQTSEMRRDPEKLNGKISQEGDPHRPTSRESHGVILLHNPEPVVLGHIDNNATETVAPERKDSLQKQKQLYEQQKLELKKSRNVAQRQNFDARPNHSGKNGLFDENLRTNELRRQFVIDKQKAPNEKKLRNRIQSIQPRPEWNEDVTINTKGVFGEPPPVPKKKLNSPAEQRRKKSKPGHWRARPHSIAAGAKTRSHRALPSGSKVRKPTQIRLGSPTQPTQALRSNEKGRIPKRNARKLVSVGTSPDAKLVKEASGQIQILTDQPTSIRPDLPQGVARQERVSRTGSKYGAASKEHMRNQAAQLDMIVAKAMASEREHLEKLVRSLVRSENKNRAALKEQIQSNATAGSQRGAKQPKKSQLKIHDEAEAAAVQSELQMLMAREDAIRKKWEKVFQDTSPSILNSEQVRTGQTIHPHSTEDIMPTLEAEFQAPHYSASNGTAQGQQPFIMTSISRVQTPSSSIDEVAFLESIEKGKSRHIRHRQIIEASLQGTGMSQYQIVESIVDILYEGFVQEVSIDVLTSCDAIAEAVFQSA